MPQAVELLPGNVNSKPSTAKKNNKRRRRRKERSERKRILRRPISSCPDLYSSHNITLGKESVT
jgi:hypothetical protein